MTRTIAKAIYNTKGFFRTILFVCFSFLCLFFHLSVLLLSVITQHVVPLFPPVAFAFHFLVSCVLSLSTPLVVVWLGVAVLGRSLQSSSILLVAICLVCRGSKIVLNELCRPA